MGNCQAAEAATVVIQHPGNKIERIYWSVSAKEIMNSNPGHYVALVVTSPTSKSENGSPLKQLKLLRPDDTLSIGNAYRLISFEDVLKEFAAKKCMKLGRLLEETGPVWRDHVELKTKVSGSPKPNPTRKSSKSENCSYVKAELGAVGSSGSGRSNNRVWGRHHGVGGGGQWKPALQSIAEIGT